MINFLVLYDARSGSTFLSRRLMEQYRILIPPEANFLANAVTAGQGEVIHSRQDLLDFCLMLANDRKFLDWGIPVVDIERKLEQSLPITLQEALVAVCELYRRRIGDGEKCFGIKKGSYIYAVERIHRFFPKMKYLCLIRDGRAVFASKKRALHSASGKPFATDPVRAARRWVAIRNRIRCLERRHSEQVLVIKYEELVHFPEEVLQRVAGFLKVERRSATIDAGASLILDKYQHLHANTGNQAQSDSIDKWMQQLSAAEIYCFETEAREVLSAEGYTLINSRRVLHRPLGRLINRMRLVSR